jgi:hypothetical protein
MKNNMKQLSQKPVFLAIACALLLLTSSACTTSSPMQKVQNTAIRTPAVPQISPTLSRTQMPTPSPATPAIPTKPAPPGFLFFTRGDGFLIAYPKDWSYPTPGTNFAGYTDDINFEDSTTNENFYVQSSPGSSNQAPLSTIAHDCALNIIFGPTPAADIQLQQVPVTRVVNGVLWYQSEVEAHFGPDGRAMYACLATRHRSGTDPNAIFTLAYSADVSIFSQLDTTAFEPMIQSFEFLA